MVFYFILSEYLGDLAIQKIFPLLSVIILEFENTESIAINTLFGAIKVSSIIKVLNT